MQRNIASLHEGQALPRMYSLATFQVKTTLVSCMANNILELVTKMELKSPALRKMIESMS